MRCLFISGKYQICADPDCDCTELETVRESWDEKDQVFAGEQRCSRCGTGMLYLRRPETPEERAMAKKAKSGGKPKRKSVHDEIADGRHRHSLKNAPEASTAGTRTIPPNGALGVQEGHPEPVPEPEKVPVGEAMRRAVEALGKVKIDDELAPQQLAQLAECYEEVERRRAAFNLRADEAKTAKKSLESAQELLLEKVRLFTHPAPLPLFDEAQREDDLEDMLDADREQASTEGTGAEA